MPLTEEEKQSLEKKRDGLVQTQFETLKTIIEAHKNNPTELHDNLSPVLKNYKPDALELAYNYMKENKFPQKTTTEMGKLWQTRHIGGIKKDRAVVYQGGKQDGVTLGERVKKLKKGSEALGLKHDKIILRKIGGNKKSRDEGEEICEYLASSLAIPIMGSKLSPKFRLHKIGEDNMVASTFIKGFKTIKDGADTENAQGFGKFFAREFLLGNYDLHIGNVGITEINGIKHWTGIDDGRALSYARRVDWDRGRHYPNSRDTNISEFIADMMAIPSQIYPEELFKGKEFCTELYSVANDIDIELMRHIKKESMENVKEIYGNDFFKNPNIAKTLKSRMNLQDPLTEEKIENAIFARIESRKQQLKTRAFRQSQEIFREALTKNDEDTIAYMRQHMPEAVYLEENKKLIVREKKIPDNLSPEALSSLIKYSVYQKKTDFIRCLNDDTNHLSVFIKECIDNQDNEPIKYILNNQSNFLPKFIKECIKNEDYAPIQRLNDRISGVSGSIQEFIKECIKNKNNESLNSLSDNTKFVSKFIKECITNEKSSLIEELNTEVLSVFIKECINAKDYSTLDYLNGLEKEVLSPLKWAITNNTDIAIELVKRGYKIKEHEIDKSIESQIIQSNSKNWFNKGETKNDELRKAIIASASSDNKNAVDLSKKPSLLYLAVETGQKDLALKLVESGYTLKRAELKLYGNEVKVSILAKVLGKYSENDKISINTMISARQKVGNMR